MNNITVINSIRFGVVLFWGIWFTLVSLSDLANIFQQLNWLSASFQFSSKNYELILKGLVDYKIYSPELALYLFVIIAMFASVLAALFMISLFSINSILPTIAFLLSFLMTAVFIVYDELVIQYTLEHGHMLRFTFQIATFILFNYAQIAYNTIIEKRIISI